jgi:uncharacterized protein (TIGR02246 family)
MKRALAVLLLTAAPAIALAKGDSAADQAKARQEIQNVLVKLANAERSGDATAVAQCYAGDGMLLPSSGDPVRGREDITKRYQAILGGKTPRLPLESEELWVLDDWAVSRGVTRVPAAKKNVKGVVRNRYVMTLKKHGDTWEIQSLVWNSVPPAK